MITLSFITTSLIIILLPGSGAVYTISIGLTLGRLKSILAALGCIVGIIPHLIVGIMSIFIFSTLNGPLISFIQVIGGLYLIYLGIMMFKASKITFTLKQNKDVKNNRIIFQAILITLLNPKLTLFFLSFLPQFINLNSNDSLIQSIVLGLVFMLLTFIIFVIYGTLASHFTNYIYEYPHRYTYVQRIFGIFLILFSLKILFIK